METETSRHAVESAIDASNAVLEAGKQIPTLAVVECMLGLPVSQLNLAPERLKAAIRRAERGISRHQSGGLSSFLRLLRNVGPTIGLSDRDNLLEGRFSDIWHRTCESAEGSQSKRALRRFAAFGCARGISPAQVDDVTWADFLSWLRQRTYLQWERVLFLEAKKAWRLTAYGKNVDMGGSTIAGRRGNMLPSSFLLSVGEFLDHLRQYGTRQRAVLSEVTIRGYARDLRVAAELLNKTGVPIESIQSLGTLLQPQNCLEIFREQIRRVTPRLPNPNVAYALRAAYRWMETHCSAGDELAIQYIDRACKAFRPSPSLSAKQFTAVVALKRSSVLRKLVGLPITLAERARTELACGRTATGIAIFEDAAMIAIYVGLGLRQKEVRSLRVDDLETEAIDAIFVRLVLRRHQNGGVVRLPLPSAYCSLMREYCSAVVAVPSDTEKGPWLFPGREGRPRCVSSLTARLTKVMIRELGRSFSSRSFRAFLAQSFQGARGAYEVHKVLGLRSPKTTAATYSDLWMLEMAQDFADRRNGCPSERNAFPDSQ
jgi:integrase